MRTETMCGIRSVWSCGVFWLGHSKSIWPVKSRATYPREFFTRTVKERRYGNSAGITIEENSGIFLNLNALVAIGKGMWAVEPRLNKIRQFLTGGAS